jgi:hypothetical protein
MTEGFGPPARFGGGSITETGSSSLQVTAPIGNDGPWKAAAPGRCFGIGEHAGNRVYGLETLHHRNGSFGSKSVDEKVRGRRVRRYNRFSSEGLVSGGSRFRSGSEQDAEHFGALHRRRDDE